MQSSIIYLSSIYLLEISRRSPEHLNFPKNFNGLVPTNDFLAIVRMAFILCDFLLVFQLPVIVPDPKIRKRRYEDKIEQQIDTDIYRHRYV
jgi:hypothetical protein